MKNQRRKRRNRRSSHLPGIECPFPQKRRFSETDAEHEAKVQGHYAGKGIYIKHYRCPAGGHWHLSSHRR